MPQDDLILSGCDIMIFIKYWTRVTQKLAAVITAKMKGDLLYGKTILL